VHKGYIPTKNEARTAIDPGNGQILSTQEVSKNELERMHIEHSTKVVQGEEHESVGFPFIIQH
jgi:hypothetical protein